MSSSSAKPSWVANQSTELIALGRRMWKDASWSLTGSLLTVGSGIATLKIVGRLVPAGDYGAASLVLGVVHLLNQFIAAPLLSERIRLYFDHLKRGGTAELSAAVRAPLLWYAALISAIYLIIAFVERSVGQPVYLRLLLPAVGLILVQPQLSAALAQLEAHRKYHWLSVFQPLVSVLQVPALLLLLWSAVRGDRAMVAAQALSSTAVFLAIQYKSRSEPRSAVRATVESALGDIRVSSFGWAMYAFSLGSWLMATSDRYVIDHFLNAGDVGIYAINYAFASIPYTVLNGWTNSLTRPRLFARGAEKDWRGVRRIVLLNLAFTTAIAVGGTVMFGLMGKRLAVWLFSERYWHSEGLMMTLALGHVFFVVGHTSASYFMAIKRPGWVAGTSLLAAVANVALNIWLIPGRGILGAALATLGTYAGWSLLMLAGIGFWSRRMRE